MDKELARTVADLIEAHPENWGQVRWYYSRKRGSDFVMPAAELLEFTCGSTGCVAGWTVAVSYPEGAFVRDEEFAVSLRAADLDSPWSVGTLAGLKLELTRGQSEWLFFPRRSLTEVLRALRSDDDGWYGPNLADIPEDPGE